MMDNEDPAMDPVAGEAQEGEDGSYTIELSVDGSGQITVSVESAADEAGEESAEPGGAPGEPAEAGQSYPDIKSALTAVLQIYKSNGKMVGPNDEKDQIAAGFKGAM